MVDFCDFFVFNCSGKADKVCVEACCLMRNMVAGVLEDVQTFYSINNAQAGLLQTSFIISYMLLSPIFGYMGDRYNRVYIMAAGVLFWSLITLAGSFIPPEVENSLMYGFLQHLMSKP